MRRSMMLCKCHACLDCKEVRRSRRAIRNHERSHKKELAKKEEQVLPKPLDELEDDMVQALKLQAVEAVKLQAAKALKKIEEDFDLGKKRTCPRCKAIFLTRKDKRLHRQLTHGACEIPEVKDTSRHRYA